VSVGRRIGTVFQFSRQWDNTSILHYIKEITNSFSFSLSISFLSLHNTQKTKLIWKEYIHEEDKLLLPNDQHVQYFPLCYFLDRNNKQIDRAIPYDQDQE
jgi:hypothetical protein